MVAYQKIGGENRDNRNVIFEAPYNEESKNTRNTGHDEDENPLLSSFSGPDNEDGSHKYSLDDDDYEDALDHRLDGHYDNVNNDDDDNSISEASSSNITPASLNEGNSSNIQYNHTILNNSIPFRIKGIFKTLFNKNKYSSGRPMGQGTDGVFSNLMAKPEQEPEQDDNHPPTYEEAAADPPPYWESTVLSPAYGDEVFVDGLPVGNIVNFVWNLLVTVAFQFVGFLLTYLLHTSHAAKEGSRAGLGITIISFGYNLMPYNYGSSEKKTEKYEPLDPNQVDVESSDSIAGSFDNYKSSLSGALVTESNDETITDTPYFPYALIALGTFIILKSLFDYYRVKQMEKVILLPPTNNLITSTSTTTTISEASNDIESETEAMEED